MAQPPDGILDSGRELVTLLVGIIAVFAYPVKRWIERPRLRVKVREHNLTTSSDGRLVFEATNHGGRVTSLKPVVLFRATKFRTNRTPLGTTTT